MENKTIFKTNSTLAQQCYEQLQTDIIDGTLKPGEKLKVERIKERFTVGQSPIREALSRLVASGLVQTEDNKGFRVAKLSETDIRDIYDTFTRVENMALALAMERGDDAWESNIVAALHQLSIIESKQEAVPYALWAERNYNFHVALIAGCKSPTLLEIRRMLYLKFDRYCRMAFNTTKDSLTVNNDEHKKMAELVLKRDFKAVQELMNHHINEPLEEIIQKLKQNNLI
jgi:GntR family carbon starvation induced transcriptional regulator